jgi:hypothetical protein
MKLACNAKIMPWHRQMPADAYYDSARDNNRIADLEQPENREGKQDAERSAGQVDRATPVHVLGQGRVKGAAVGLLFPR